MYYYVEMPNPSDIFLEYINTVTVISYMYIVNMVIDIISIANKHFIHYLNSYEILKIAFLYDAIIFYIISTH